MCAIANAGSCLKYGKLSAGMCGADGVTLLLGLSAAPLICCSWDFCPISALSRATEGTYAVQ